MANEVRINVTSRDKTGPGFKSARNNADELGKSTRRVGEIAAGILASGVFERIAAAAKRAFTDTIAAASNLNESVNAVGVVFGEAADGVMAIGESSAESMGLSQRAFNEAAVRFSAFAETIAGEGGDVAGVVEEVTQRSSDFASVMNIDVAQAMQLFQSGLAGESEPLRRYGIDVSAAATNTFAWANGIAEAGAELSEAEKVQARYGLIMEQTSDTQGDFANTSDDLANAQRIFNAELEDMQAQMGQNMLPVLGEVVSFLTDVLRGFQKLPAPVQQVTTGLAGLTGIATAGAIALRALGVSAAMMQKALGPIGIALAVGGAILGGLTALGKSSQEASGDVEGLAQTLERGTGAFTMQTREAALLALQQEGLVRTAQELGIAADDVTAAYLGEEDALRRVNAVIDQAIAEGTSYNEVKQKGVVIRTDKVYNDEAEAALALKDAIAAGNITTDEAIQLARDLGIVTEETAEVISEEGKKAAEEWGVAVADIAGGNEVLRQANDDLAENEELTTERIIEAGRKRVEAQVQHTENVEKVRERASEDVRDLMVEEAKEFPELAALARDATEEEWAEWEEIYRDKVAAANKAANQELVANTPKLAAIAEGAGDEAALKIASALRDGGPLTVAEAKKIFKNVDAEFQSDILQIISPQLNAEALRQVEIALNGVARPRTVSLRMETFGTQGIGGQNASGGNVGAARGMATGGMSGSNRVLVGEHRPEVVDLPVGSRVIPSVDQATDRGQGGTSQDPATAVIDKEDLQTMMRMLVQGIARALDGATLTIDDRGQGRLMARQADLLGRAG